MKLPFAGSGTTVENHGFAGLRRTTGDDPLR